MVEETNPSVTGLTLLDLSHYFLSRLSSAHSTRHVSVTVLPSLLPALVYLSERRLAGALNFVNPGAISHDEVLAIYAVHRHAANRKEGAALPPFRWRNFRNQEEMISCGAVKAARSDNCLDTQRLQRVFDDRVGEGEDDGSPEGQQEERRGRSQFRILSAREAVLRAIQGGGYSVPHPVTGR